ncbi:EamA family transporter [Heliobacterium gestii]|uniref:EamA family transporter n=1 Tax=Heliomicrobium gestii TaxID=2699 RepID=A0A845LH00_HELGE|nr:EamA family transporter [Heliomicrobium gestii]MBM7867431.1 drug/metabolite transporter (DMT)-like permease [Heliomicrobium gestii]MZP43695.1 EamA family transporter [Heliomicrobium gestii]
MTGYMLMFVLLCWGLWPIMDKKFLTGINPWWGIFWAELCGLLFLPLLYWIAKKYGGDVEGVPATLGWGFLSRLLDLMGLMFFYILLSKNPAGWTIITVSMYPLVTLFFGILFFGETLNGRVLMGSACVLSGLMLLMRR